MPLSEAFARGDGPASESYEDLYENAPCGYLSVGADGRVARANLTFAAWAGYQRDELAGRRFSDLLNIAGKIFFETHVAPLLRMQGFFDEFAIDLITSDGSRLPAIANARERRGDDGHLRFIRLTIIRATDRRRFERNLIDARKESDHLRIALEENLRQERNNAELREQFIAVLGHDLRNPLASISGGARLMLKAKSTADAARIEAMMQTSVTRMAKMIDSVMDLARGRLGGGIPISKSVIAIEPVLDQVVAELAAAHPDKVIEVNFEIEKPIFCDGLRMAQLFSNLLANAINHGAEHHPIRVNAKANDKEFILSVANTGIPISDETKARLFLPFCRGPDHGPAEGLGLGLYIASEIAKAHSGDLEVTSSDLETRFTFSMKSQNR